jgi:DNA polymerase
MRVDLAGPIDVRDFRAQANSMLAHQVAPAEIAWSASVTSFSGVAFRGGAIAASGAPSALHSIVPRSFVRLTELVVLHRDPDRFALLYRLLWRLVHEPELAGSRGDDDLAHAQSMAQAVRRDIAKARLSARLRPLPPRDGASLSVARCDPQHQVTEHVAEWLAVQLPQPMWLLSSADRCVLWTGRHLLCGPGMTARAAGSMDDVQWYQLATRLAERSA